EARQARTEEGAGRGRGGEPEAGAQRGRGGGAEAADPVGWRRGFAARRPREDVRIVGVVRREGERREHPGEQQQESDRLAREAALPERFLAQSLVIIGRKGAKGQRTDRAGASWHNRPGRTPLETEKKRLLFLSTATAP